MQQLTFTLPDFEGPLDLLLHLVQKNKFNIYDIPIHALLAQYMDTLGVMQSMDLDVASEFLDMAARLVQMKSAMLLPRHEEADQLRRELTGELIEYQLCREAALRLASHYIGGDLFVRAPTELEVDRSYIRRHGADELTEAYLSAAGRGKRRLPPPAQAFTGIVARQVVSVTSKIIHVLRRLHGGAPVRYDALYDTARSRSEIVATFLALLQLIKGERVRLEGQGGRMRVRLLGRVKGER